MAEQDLGEQLESLAAELNSAVQHYKSYATGTTDDLEYRRSVAEAATKVLVATKVPEEQWAEQSVWMAEMAAIRIFMKWKAFEFIPEEGDGISYAELAAKLDAEEALVNRIAWVLVSTGVLKQLGEDHVVRTRLASVYVNNHPSGKLFQIMYDEGLVPYSRWPAYFEKYGRKEPKGKNHNPHSFAWGEPEAEIWDILNRDGDRMKDMMQALNTMEQNLPITGMYDFSWVDEAAAKEPQRTILVDVGGGKGHAILALAKEYPVIDVKRTVLQDRLEVIAEVDKIDTVPGARTMAHNFYTENPVKGALIYWLRRIIHDYSDDNCIVILKHLADAAAPDSKILICELIIDNPPTPLVAQTDLVVMNMSGKERSIKMFNQITEKAGLKVVNVHRHKSTPAGVVECVKA